MCSKLSLRPEPEVLAYLEAVLSGFDASVEPTEELAEANMLDINSCVIAPDMIDLLFVQSLEPIIIHSRWL